MSCYALFRGLLLLFFLCLSQTSSHTVCGLSFLLGRRCSLGESRFCPFGLLLATCHFLLPFAGLCLRACRSGSPCGCPVLGCIVVRGSGLLGSLFTWALSRILPYLSGVFTVGLEAVLSLVQYRLVGRASLGLLLSWPLCVLSHGFVYELFARILPS